MFGGSSNRGYHIIILERESDMQRLGIFEESWIQLAAECPCRRKKIMAARIIRECARRWVAMIDDAGGEGRHAKV